jgi:hypothetical protein
MLEDILPKSSILFCFFSWTKVSMQSIFINKYFLFTVISVCRVKRFTTRWKTYLWSRRGWNGGAEVVDTTVKILLCCGFRSIGKIMEDKSRNRFFFIFEYHIFYVLYPFVTHLLTLPCIARKSLKGFWWNLVRICWHSKISKLYFNFCTKSNINILAAPNCELGRLVAPFNTGIWNYVRSRS